MNESPRKIIEASSSDIYKEFMVLAKHKDLYEILSGSWLYDENYPAPSKEFIVFLSYKILNDKKMMERLGAMTRDRGLKHIATKIVDTSNKPDKLEKIAYEEGFRQYAAGLMFKTDSVSKNCANWWDLMAFLCFPDTTTERVVAKYCIEYLTSHSLWHGDKDMILALAEVLELLHKRKYPENTTGRAISHLLYYFHSYLETKLGRYPAKSELKDFVQGVTPRLDGSERSWKTALRDCRLKFRPARTGKRDPKVIEQLVLDWYR